MLNNVVCIVSDSEKTKAEKLYERNNSLYELFLVLDELYITNEEKKILKEKLLINKNKTFMSIENWWKEICTKYRLENEKELNLNYITGEIKLIKQ